MLCLLKVEMSGVHRASEVPLLRKWGARKQGGPCRAPSWGLWRPILPAQTPQQVLEVVPEVVGPQRFRHILQVLQGHVRSPPALGHCPLLRAGFTQCGPLQSRPWLKEGRWLN